MNCSEYEMTVYKSICDIYHNSYFLVAERLLGSCSGRRIKLSAIRQQFYPLWLDEYHQYD